MRVAYVTMIFPASSEVFACLDIRALLAADVAVEVFTMRRARPHKPRYPWSVFTSEGSRAANALLSERGLATLRVCHSTPGAVVRGFALALRRPRIAADLFVWVLRSNWRHPTHLCKSLLLLPRTLDIFEALRHRSPDVVHLFWGHYPANVGYLVRRHLPDVVLSLFLGAYDLLRGYPGSAAVAQMADVVWTHAAESVAVIEQLGVPRSSIRVAYRGTAVAALPPATHKVTHRVVTVGRLVRPKAMDDVLAVFARLLVQWPDASLVVLGDGQERDRLAALARAWGIADVVRFAGHRSHEDVQAELAVAEAFVLMSRSPSERLPNAAKEAMAAGCVCLATRSPGIEELIEDGVHGFVVAPGDVDGAARRLDDLFRNPERMAPIVAAARARIAARFDVRQSMDRYRECWQGLLAARRPEPPGPRSRHLDPAARAQSA